LFSIILPLGHNDEETDERLQECCELDIVAVPFDYIEHCIQHGQIPYRLYAMASHMDRTFNPSADPLLGRTASAAARSYSHHKKGQVCVLGVTEFGNVDYRSRESEELNQS
jgi:hypothetical protein